MEPIASSSQPARPQAGATGQELAQLLRQGRVLAGEVLSNSGDGTLLLALGRHRVPAETNLRLDPGTRFLARVAQGKQGLVLELLGGEAAGDPELLTALRAVVGDDRPLGELLGELHLALRARRGPGVALPRAAQDLAEALLRLAARPEGAEGLRAALLSTGLAHEAGLAGVLKGLRARDELERLRGDLKALLLRAGNELPAGSLREAVQRVLSGLEAEQLLNLARERAGEPVLLSLPVPDGEGWTTARLLVPPRDEGSDGRERTGARRIALGVELSSLGPVRVDLLLGPSVLSVSLLVTRPDLAQRIEQDLETLRSRLDSGARGVRISVRLGTPEEASVGARPLDTPYLHEHRLLNVAG